MFVKIFFLAFGFIILVKKLKPTFVLEKQGLPLTSYQFSIDEFLSFSSQSLSLESIFGSI
jgi:hypothetical protein